MLCTIFGEIWLRKSREEVKNDKKLQTDGQTDGRTTDDHKSTLEHSVQVS